MDNRFDQQASQWDQQASRVKMAADIAEAMARALRLGSDRDLLDFGAGTGLVTLRFQPQVRKVFAFDTSVGMLRTLQEAFGDRDVAVGRELTKIFEEIVRGTIKDVLKYFENNPGKIKGEFVIIIY